MSVLQKAIDLVTKATEEDTKRNYPEALRLYEHGVEYFLHAMKIEACSEKSKASIRDKCEIYLDRCDKIRQYFKRKEVNKAKGFQREDSRDSDEDEGGRGFERKLLRASTIESPDVQWGDVIGLSTVKEDLKESFILPEKFPHMFTGTRKPWQRVLLYGPPGTGKSMLAQAVAMATQSAFISLSTPYAVTHWEDNSETMLDELFAKASEKKSSIVLLDQIETLCTSERLMVEFIHRMDQQKSAESGTKILATTHEPWRLDPSLRGRFEKTIYVPLPDTTDRSDLFKEQMGTTPNNLSEEDYTELGTRTKGYSGSDISRVVRKATMEPVRKVQMATHFRKVRGPSRSDPNVIVDDLLTPCSPGAPGAIEMSWTDVPGDKLLEPIVSKTDLLGALSTSKPTTEECDLAKFEQFSQDFGSSA